MKIDTAVMVMQGAIFHLLKHGWVLSFMYLAKHSFILEESVLFLQRYIEMLSKFMFASTQAC